MVEVIAYPVTHYAWHCDDCGLSGDPYRDASVARGLAAVHRNHCDAATPGGDS